MPGNSIVSRTLSRRGIPGRARRGVRVVGAFCDGVPWRCAALQPLAGAPAADPATAARGRRCRTRGRGGEGGEAAEEELNKRQTIRIKSTEYRIALV